MLDDLVHDASTLPRVPPDAAGAYADRSNVLAEHVDAAVQGHPGLRPKLAGVPPELLRTNHRNHASFMTAVFALNAWEVMARTIPWVYQSYAARGVPVAYFPVVVQSFRDALRVELPDAWELLDPAYAFLSDHHDDYVALSFSAPPLREVELAPQADRFFHALIRSDAKEIMAMVRDRVHSDTDVAPLYTDVITPALVEVGRQWEMGRVSVAQEHVATALATRACASLYERFILRTPDRGGAIVTCAAQELHELGARMLADVLEIAGFDVRYAGADTPTAAMRSLLDPPPALVAVSASMFQNVPRVKELVTVVRGEPGTTATRILVGGRAFLGAPELAVAVGADAFSKTLAEGVDIALRWEARQGIA